RARSRSRNALQPGDDAAAVRGVLQENTQHLACLVFVHQLVGRDVTLFLEDARDFRLELRNRNINTLVLGGRRVAEARQKIGYWIRLHNSPVLAPLTAAATSWLSRHRGFLPSAPYRGNRFCTSETCGYNLARG